MDSDRKAAHNKATIEFNRRQDNIMIRTSKEHGQRIRAAASAAGQSVRAYVLQAVNERMERDQDTQAE